MSKKYRYWDKKKKVFLVNKPNLEKMYPKFCLDTKLCRFLEDYVAQGNTGYKDYNYNPIFEGDILRLLSLNKRKSYYVEVKLLTDWGWNLDSVHFGTLYHKEEWEVVGNNLQNPELLKLIED